MIAVWARKQPRSLRHAMQMCLAYAHDVGRLSVERVAERMGLANHWALYKWMESGRLPAILIRPFETACGADYVTRWLAASDHKLVVQIPTGRAVEACDTAELQVVLAEASRLLIKFYSQGGDPGATLDALRDAIAGLGYHHANVERSLSPELDLEGGA